MSTQNGLFRATETTDPAKVWTYARTIFAFCQTYGTKNIGWADFLRNNPAAPADKGKSIFDLIKKKDHIAACTAIKTIITDFSLKTDPAPSDPPEETALPLPPTPPDSDEDEIKKHLAEIERIMRDKAEAERKAKIPTYDPKEPDYHKPAYFDELTNLVKTGLGVMLVGPRGCGKTMTCRMVAKALNMDFFKFDFGGRPGRAQVFGSMSLKEGSTKWTPSPLLTAMMNPGVILFDEVNSMDPDIAQGLNGLTERSDRTYLAEDGNVYKRHPECYIIGASNADGQSRSRTYTAAQVQDASLLDRFPALFRLEYDLDVEKQIMTKAKIGPEARKYVRENFDKVRRNIEANNIQCDLGTRRLADVVFVVAQGIDHVKAFERIVLGQFNKADRAKAGF